MPSACLAVRMPPASFRPTSRPVASAWSRIASAMHRAVGGVADTGSLPVEVLMTSLPAAIAITDARRIIS